MEKIIIGIHGLMNKPPKDLLSYWWQESIREGLLKNCQIHDPEFNFDIVFWADLLYKKRLHDDENFYFDSLYNPEPYTPAKPGALKPYRDGIWDQLQRHALDVAGDAFDLLNFNFNLDSLVSLPLDQISFVRDLQFYYKNYPEILNRQGELEPVQKVLRDDLKQVILAYQEQEIMLVAHSMGSIIAYDALRDLGQENPDAKVEHFVTIGTPLGLPYVKKQIIKERDYSPEVRTPSIVTQSWINYTDRRDPIALDAHLSDDYSDNSRGIRVKDDLILNDYENPLKPGTFNYHKSYGYLRAPEFSNYVKEFLN